MNFKKDEAIALEACHNLFVEDMSKHDHVEYKTDLSMMIARVITDIHASVQRKGLEFVEVFAQQYILQKGLKVFGNRGEDGAYKELEQLHKRTCFSPISIKEMTPIEKKKAMNALMFLTEKRDKSVKGRLVYDGKPTRDWLSREDSASPTAAIESILITTVIDAHEGRDEMTSDIPNAFIQTKLPEGEDGDERIIMKITGVIVDLLVSIAPDVYGPYVVYENGKRFYMYKYSVHYTECL